MRDQRGTRVQRGPDHRATERTLCGKVDREELRRAEAHGHKEEGGGDQEVAQHGAHMLALLKLCAAETHFSWSGCGK